MVHTRNHKKGMTLVEVVVYIGVAVVILFAIVSIVLFVIRSLSDLQASRDIRNSAITALERMGREIRGAESIGDATVFDQNIGQLELNTGDTPATVLFTVSDGVIQLSEDGTYIGDLTLPTATVTAMTLHRITTARSEGIRVELTFESIDPNQGTSTTFYTTGIVRASYYTN